MLTALTTKTGCQNKLVAADGQNTSLSDFCTPISDVFPDADTPDSVLENLESYEELQMKRNRNLPGPSPASLNAYAACFLKSGLPFPPSHAGDSPYRGNSGDLPAPAQSRARTFHPAFRQRRIAAFQLSAPCALPCAEPPAAARGARL